MPLIDILNHVLAVLIALGWLRARCERRAWIAECDARIQGAERRRRHRSGK
jgi:hypothetical protein